MNELTDKINSQNENFPDTPSSQSSPGFKDGCISLLIVFCGASFALIFDIIIRKSIVGSYGSDYWMLIPNALLLVSFFIFLLIWKSRLLLMFYIGIVMIAAPTILLIGLCGNFRV